MVACALANAAATAAIYRWVDNDGHVHFSDVVPEQYKSSAVRVESAPPSVSAEQRRQAEERAARDKRSLGPQSASPAASAAAAPASAAPPARRPATGVTPSTDCDTWRRLYRESIECFDPYRTARGGIKPEAFERCTPIPEPDPRCGRSP